MHLAFICCSFDVVIHLAVLLLLLFFLLYYFYSIWFAFFNAFSFHFISLRFVYILVVAADIVTLAHKSNLLWRRRYVKHIRCHRHTFTHLQRFPYFVDGVVVAAVFVAGYPLVVTCRCKELHVHVRTIHRNLYKAHGWENEHNFFLFYSRCSCIYIISHPDSPKREWKKEKKNLFFPKLQGDRMSEKEPFTKHEY